MAYIDSELAKRRYMQTTTSQSSGANGIGTGSTIDAFVQRQPAALGKLQEVDLGPDAASLNAERTELAKRRLEGGEIEPEESAGKIRMGKDGKPRRARRRRNSDDVKRDKMVEDVLRESKRKQCFFSTFTTSADIQEQSTSTMSRKSSYLTMTRQQMIVLRNSSGENSWTPYHSASRRKLSQRRNQVQALLLIQ